MSYEQAWIAILCKVSFFSLKYSMLAEKSNGWGIFSLIIYNLGLG